MKSQIKDIYNNYKNFWWFDARYDLLSKIIDSKNKKILEIGCASGENSQCFKNSQYCGIDISSDLLSRGTHPNLILGTANILPFKNNSVDVIILPDILEHLENEASCLSEVNRVLKDDGKILILVPAFPFLWNNHDILNEHKRRYTKASLAKILTQFKIEKFTYWNSFLFLPVVISKLFNRKNKTGITKVPKIVNSLLLKILKLENKLICNGIYLPIGISLMCVCDKR